MPKNTDYLSELARYNHKHGITATFSEMKKTARRIQKLADERDEAIEALTVEAFFLLHSDPTGEEAATNVDAERAEQNKANAARRVAA